jgi:Protein of unknown function (DUF4007)
LSSRLAENAQRRFAGHETFAPRFGWLRKAHIAVSTTPAPVSNGRTPPGSDAFLRASAQIDLGVGKNMVTSIRYWAQAFGITCEAPQGGASRAFLAHPTEEGQWLLGDDGVDPWLEHPASLWLLHWWLLRPKCLAPTWWVTFYIQPSARFHEHELTALVESQVALAGWDAVMTSSVAKDVDCLTKMYAPRRSATGSPGSVEDLLDCPFRELGLLEAVPGTPRTWRFADVPRLAVPPAVAGYAALDYMARNELSGQVTTARLAHEPGAVGHALRMTEPALAAALSGLSARTPELRVVDSVGQRSLIVNGDPAQLARAVINAHYRGDDRATTAKRSGQLAASTPRSARTAPSRTAPPGTRKRSGSARKATA